MVGEIRDLETAEMAIQAALTGHLVFQHAAHQRRRRPITRLLDLGVPPYLINATLLGVMAQRLVRTLCPHCKRRGGAARRRDLADADLAMARPRDQHIYRAEGCLECRMTGYLRTHRPVRDHEHHPGGQQLVRTGADLPSLREQAYRDGMKPLRASGAMKVAAGQTTVEEVMKVAPL